MVLSSGSPKASVFCDAQNVAAIASEFDMLTNFDLKNFNRIANEPICNDDKRPNKKKP